MKIIKKIFIAIGIILRILFLFAVIFGLIIFAAFEMHLTLLAGIAMFILFFILLVIVFMGIEKGNHFEARVIGIFSIPLCLITIASAFFLCDKGADSLAAGTASFIKSFNSGKDDKDSRRSSDSRPSPWGDRSRKVRESPPASGSGNW